MRLEKRENWVCVVARDSRFGDRLSLKEYLAASHIVVGTYPGVQTIPDKQMAVGEIADRAFEYLISA